jgi:hypothetical protein
MDKDEILAKSREENKNEDEREKRLRMGSVIPAFIAMGSIGATLMILEMIFLDTELLSCGLRLMLHGCLCVQNWYLWATLRKKYMITLSILWTFIAAGSVWSMIQVFISMS